MCSTAARRAWLPGSFTLGLVLISGCLTQAGIARTAFLEFTVKVYNSAHVSPGDLVQAEERAARIFRQAKIKIVWDHVPMPDEAPHQAQGEAWNPAAIHLRLCTRAMVGSKIFGEDTLGFRVSTENSTAIVIADEIRNRAATEFTNSGDLLGLVMAHEMGHLLLGSKAHSAEGIMQARLPSDLRDRRRTLLVFNRRQGSSIRGEVQRRMSIQSTKTLTCFNSFCPVLFGAGTAAI
jgi:hypothetical protein